MWFRFGNNGTNSILSGIQFFCIMRLDLQSMFVTVLLLHFSFIMSSVQFPSFWIKRSWIFFEIVPFRWLAVMFLYCTVRKYICLLVREICYFSFMKSYTPDADCILFVISTWQILIDCMYIVAANTSIWLLFACDTRKLLTIWSNGKRITDYRLQQKVGYIKIEWFGPTLFRK
jgi:hypothetical protein